MEDPHISQKGAVDFDFVSMAKGVSIVAVISWHIIAPFFDSALRAQTDVGVYSPFHCVIIFIHHLLGFGSSFFLVLSGYILTMRFGILNFSVKAFYRKRLSRLFVPFILWLPVYLLMSRNVKDFGDIVLRVIFFEGSYHFWFIWVILLCYFLFPIILYSQERLLLMKPSGLGSFGFFLLPLSLIILSIVVLNISPLHITDSWTINFIINKKFLILPGNLSYFVGGVCLALMCRRDIQPLKDRSKYAGILVVAAICIASARLFLFFTAHGYYIREYVEFVLQRLHIGVAIGIILLAFASTSSNGFFPRVLKTLGRSSYGIFLGHAVILDASRTFLSPIFGTQHSLFASGVFILTMLGCYYLSIPKKSRVFRLFGFSTGVSEKHLTPIPRALGRLATITLFVRRRNLFTNPVSGGAARRW